LNPMYLFVFCLPRHIGRSAFG